MSLETITLDDVEYVRKDSCESKSTTKQIVVLQRGHVVVGDVLRTDADVSIKNCSVIRVWGTSRGLGEIAENGPTDKTKLDKCPDIFVHPLSVVLYMNTNKSNW